MNNWYLFHMMRKHVPYMWKDSQMQKNRKPRKNNSKIWKVHFKDKRTADGLPMTVSQQCD